jgi:outer membrane protein W
MTTWNLTARFYSNTDFAPLGPYFGVGIHWVHFTNMSDGSSGGNTFGLHLSLGRNYVFLQRLLLNIEARYSYTYGLLDFMKSLANLDSRLHMADAVVSNVMMLRIGLGVLPF